MKDNLFSILVEMISDHPRTFELFAFTLVFLFAAIAIEYIGLMTTTAQVILITGGIMTILAIVAGAIEENGGF